MSFCKRKQFSIIISCSHTSPLIEVLGVHKYMYLNLTDVTYVTLKHKSKVHNAIPKL